MIRTARFAAAALVPVAMALLSACGGGGSKATDSGGETVSTSSVQCVEIPDGYYLFADGKFSPTREDMAIELPPEVTQKQIVWINEFEDRMMNDGFPWLRLDSVDKVLVLSGEAESAEVHEDAVARVRSEISADRALADRDLYIIDAITGPDTPRQPGAVLASLTPDPEVDICRTRADQITRTDTIAYVNEDTGIDEVSQPLLNAIAGLAMICEAHPLEIGVHTDARGAQSFNQTRSQKRADAIVDYLVEQGVARDRMDAVGYGETRPIDPAQTSEAYALNRRVEFYFRDEAD
ncbi:MAG: OmpA family protein [Henriciella sp.]|uniref:OmpA family protein n=1 Tax=Henriciella sp. TaxID=1968823 RepID=UPI0032ECB85F